MKHEQSSPTKTWRAKEALIKTTALLTLLVLLMLGAIAAQAQTATIYGSVGNFDVVNNTGHDAHGFEVQLEGLQASDITYTFSFQRYGGPQIIPYATGVYVRWTSPYDPTAQLFTQSTIAHAPNTPFAGSCYMGGNGYNSAGCEHFGIALTANATSTTARWLIVDPLSPSALTPVDPPMAIAAPVYYYAPPAAAGNPPVLVAEVQAPEPAEAPDVYGDAQWMKVFKTQLPREVGLDELLTGNPIVPQDATQVETSWTIVQVEPVSANGKQKRQRKQNMGNLDPTTRAVVRRYEMYNFTGTYDPVTHEALCADLLCNAPSTGELGDFISAQMTAANVQADSLTVTKSGNGNVDSADKLISCGNKCVSPYIAGTVVTLTAKAASGSVFSGWTGACTGAGSTCSVSANGHVDVGATFTLAPAGGGGGGGGAAGGGAGGGTTTASFTLSIGRSGKGSVTSAPNGIGCGTGGSCSAKFASATVVTLTATPEVGSHFVGWSGGITSANATSTVTVGKDTSVQATFAKN